MTKGNDEAQEDQGTDKTKQDAIAPGFSEDLNNWLGKAGIRANKYAFDCYVHRNLPDKTTRYLRSYSNEFPDLDEFGLEYGGGKYSINVQVYKGSKKEGTHSVFYIDDTFNEKRRQAEEKKQNEKIAGVVATAPMVEAKQIVELVQSLLQTAAAAKPANDNISMVRLMNGLIEDQLKSNFRLVSQARRKLLDNFEDANFEELPAPQQEQPNPLIETITGLIEQYAPTILGGGPAADAVVKAAKGFLATKAAAPIVNDPTAMKRIIHAVNSKYGPDQTRQLFALIGFKL